MMSDLSLKNLINALRKLTDWYDLGLQLDIEDHWLEKFSSENQRIEKCKLAMLQFWLQSDEEASWEKLISALREMNQNRLATEIQKKYQMSSRPLSEHTHQLVPQVTTQSGTIPTTAPPSTPPTDPPVTTQSGSILTTAPFSTPPTDPPEQRKARVVLRKVLSQCVVQCMCVGDSALIPIREK